VFVIGGLKSLSGLGGRGYWAIAFVYVLNKQTSVSIFAPTSATYAASSSVRAAMLAASTLVKLAGSALQTYKDEGDESITHCEKYELGENKFNARNPHLS
jgi:hypothetical protein